MRKRSSKPACNPRKPNAPTTTSPKNGLYDSGKGVAIILYPDDEFSVSLHVDYNSKVIGNQYATFNPEDDYASKIAPCRTFVFLHDLEPLMKMNLIKGGDLDNAIVVVENPVPDDQLEHLKKIFNKQDIRITGGYLNNLELRFNNELARHKLLDLLGDFALLGKRIKGRVWATRPGHFANTEFMKQVKQTIRREGEKPRFQYDCRNRRFTTSTISAACCPTARRFCWWTASSTSTIRWSPASRTSR